MRQYNKNVRGKLFKYFSQRLNINLSTKGWYRCDCIYCGGKNTMGIHLNHYRVHCFKCEVKENPIKLLMSLEGLEEYREAWVFLKVQQDYELYRDYVQKKIQVKPVKLPDSYRLISDVDCFVGKCARNYLKKRGFKLKEMEAKGVGYCTSGEYMGYIIFPCYQGDNLVFFQGRKFIDIGPKMKNPPLEQFGVGKVQVIYNGDALFIYNSIYLVESITNALTLGDRGVATLGKSVSQWQLNYLLRSPCTHVTILLDEDAYIEALVLAMQIVQFKKVRVVKLPVEKDVNDLGKRGTLGYVRSQPWQTYNDLLKIKISLNAKSAKYSYNRERIGISPTRGF